MDYCRSFCCSILLEGNLYMPATLSPEGKLITALSNIDCSAQAFVRICAEIGVQTSIRKLSEAFHDKTTFDSTLAEQLLDVSAELCGLQNSLRVQYRKADEAPPIDWTRSAQIVRLLIIRRLKQQGIELGLE
jgi:hypothetical protein